MEPAQAKAALIELLQRAFSGELAAAHAYWGHAKSVSDPRERQDIERIRDEELEHRRDVGKMLAELGGAPNPRRETVFRLIGMTISFLCRLGGWFIPMYGAGKLERGNIVEYEHAAAFARDAGYTHLVDPLLTMAEKEWDHELYFRTKAASSFWWRLTPGWSAPPPRETIRSSFVAQPGLKSVTS